MRTLRLVIRGGAVLVACGIRSSPGEHEAPDDASLDATVKDAADEEPIFGNLDGSEGSLPVGDAGYCQGSNLALSTRIVPIPNAGTPADIDQICAVSTGPVVSNTAARVTFTKYSQSLETAMGYIAIPSSLLNRLKGFPKVSVTKYSDLVLASLKTSSFSQVSGGYSFAASWPSAISDNTDGNVSMTVAVTLTLICPDGGTEDVVSSTNIILCAESPVLEWVSSGDPCTTCTVQIIAEMAPSPIVSDNPGDDLALGRVIRARIREIARIGTSVVLWVENDGGPSVEYEWRARGGKVHRIAPDIVVWTVDDPNVPSSLQAALWSDAGAAVTSYEVPS